LIGRSTPALGQAVSVILTGAVAFGAALGVIALHNYGWTLFVGLPYFIGFLAATILRRWGPKRLGTCLLVAGEAAGVVSLAFLLLGQEGIICIILALPIALPFVLLGAGMAYLLLHRRAIAPPAGAAALLVVALAGLLWAEGRIRRVAPSYTVSDGVTIATPPAVVWHALVTMGSLGQPRDLLFRMGVACPQRVDIYGTGEGALRVCTLTTGQLQERITSWEPGREMRWVSVSTPPPLRELNPFHRTDPPHLRGFYRSVGGQFELRALGPTATRVIRSSTYQHNLYPAWYWRLWCDYVARRGHVHVLNVLKQDAERNLAAASLTGR